MKQIPVFAMSNLRSERTGLPGSIYIWISNKAGSKHGARIKVSKIRGRFAEKSQDTFSVTISDSPRIVAGTSEFSTDELNSIFQWVKQNKTPLLEFWASDTMDYEDIKPRLKPL